MKGSNRGRWHGCKQRPQKRAPSNNSLRVTVSLDDQDRQLIEWLAEKKDRPVAQVLRDAVAAYVLPFKNNPTLKTTFKG